MLPLACVPEAFTMLVLTLIGAEMTTSNEQVPTFPAWSLNSYVCVVEPTGNSEPLGNPAVCAQLPPAKQLSTAVGAA